MPYRDGHVVDWKWTIEEFGKIVGDENLPTKDKLIQLAKIVDTHPAFDDEDMLDDFANRLNGAAEFEDECEQETEGDEVISDIYDYADENLIWLGAA